MDNPLVLLIDEGVACSSMMRAQLGQDGFNVVLGPSVEGCKLAVDLNPDIVMIDVGTPSGLTLISELRHDPRTCDLMVIAVAGRDHHEALALALEEGADAAISKPNGLSGLEAYL